jgi:hypothetical protein
MKKKHCISTNADETAVYNDFVEAIDKACSSLKHQTYRPPALSNGEFEKAFSRDEKSALGGDIKRLLDMLRVAKLQQLGYRAEVIQSLVRDKKIDRCNQISWETSTSER